MLINLIIILGVWGYAPPGKLCNVSRPFLVASEHLDGEKPVSNIHWFPSIVYVSQMLQGCGMVATLEVGGGGGGVVEGGSQLPKGGECPSSQMKPWSWTPNLHVGHPGAHRGTKQGTCTSGIATYQLYQ